MKVIADLCLIPLVPQTSLSGYVATCQQILNEAGLKLNLHAYGTNIEGEWDEVMAAIKHCHKAIHGQGVPRISTTIKLSTRTDRDQTIGDKVESVRSKLKK